MESWCLARAIEILINNPKAFEIRNCRILYEKPLNERKLCKKNSQNDNFNLYVTLFIASQKCKPCLYICWNAGPNNNSFENFLT